MFFFCCWFFAESLFTLIAEWPYLLTTWLLRTFYRSPSTLPLLKVRGRHVLHLTEKIFWWQWLWILTYFNSHFFSSFLPRGTGGRWYVTLASYTPSHVSWRMTDRIKPFVSLSDCRSWYQSQTEFPRRGAGAQTSFRVSLAALSQRSDQSVEWYVSRRH